MNDQIPSEVATALLTSGQSMSNRFRKNCQRARERIAEPVSRSTLLPISAPKTGAQRLQARLKRMNARQLIQAHKRALRRGNRLQDQRMDASVKVSLADGDSKNPLELFDQHISVNDAICEAYQLELDNRAKRGKVIT